MGHETIRDGLPSREQYDDLILKAAQGSKDSLNELRTLLAEHPVLYRTLGDFSRHLRHQLVEFAASGHPDTRAAMLLFLGEKRRELLAEGDTLPEQLLVDQVLVTMVDAQVCHVGHLQPHGTERLKDRWRRYLAKAQQRHQAAVKALVEARTMINRSSVTTF